MSQDPSQVEKNADVGQIDMLEKEGAVHLEHVQGLTSVKEWDQLRQDAITAESLERQITLRQAFKTYPTAIFWSFAISLCIIM